MAHNTHDEHDFAHPAPVWLLVLVFLTLMFLTVVTVALSYVDLGRWEVWTSLAIATVKATLVVLFFMHMLWDKPFNAIVFLTSLLFVALFVGGTLSDSQTYQDLLIPAESTTDAL